MDMQVIIGRGVSGGGGGGEGVVVNLRNLGGHAGNYWKRCEWGGGGGGGGGYTGGGPSASRFQDTVRW